MTRNVLASALVAGIIAAVIALLMWHFAADASWGRSALIALGFFVGTTIVAALITQAASSRKRPPTV